MLAALKQRWKVDIELMSECIAAAEVEELLVPEMCDSFAFRTPHSVDEAQHVEALYMSDEFGRDKEKVKAFLTKHIGSELRQLEHPTGRNPFTREILGQTPADRVAKLAAGEVPNAAPWREQVAEWLRLLEL